MRVAPEIVLTSEERSQLSQLLQSENAGTKLVHRARIVLLAAGGMQNKGIAALHGWLHAPGRSDRPRRGHQRKARGPLSLQARLSAGQPAGPRRYAGELVASTSIRRCRFAGFLHDCMKPMSDGLVLYRLCRPRAPPPRSASAGDRRAQDSAAPRLRAVTSISIRMRGSASPAEIIIAAGRTSPKYLRNTGQHCANSSALGST